MEVNNHAEPVSAWRIVYHIRPYGHAAPQGDAAAAYGASDVSPPRARKGSDASSMSSTAV